MIASQAIMERESWREALLKKLRRHDAGLDVWNGPGVFALWVKGEIVYIGKSCHIAAGVKAHQRNKKFDQISAVTVKEESDRTDLREWLVGRLRPRLNWTVHRDYLQPTECSLCHCLTDDPFALETPLDCPVECPNCKAEGQILSLCIGAGFITKDGRLASDFKEIFDRHYPKEGGVK